MEADAEVDFKPGEKVVFRDGATTDGKLIPEAFTKLTWEVVRKYRHEHSFAIVISTDSGHLVYYTLPKKLRHAKDPTPYETP